MPSIAAIVTRGFGSYASVNDVPTRGFGTNAVLPPEPAATIPGGHDGTRRRKRRARVIKYHEFATLQEREAALKEAITEAEVTLSPAPVPLAPEVDEQIRKMERILKKYREEREFMDLAIKVLLH